MKWLFRSSSEALRASDAPTADDDDLVGASASAPKFTPANNNTTTDTLTTSAFGGQDGA